MKLPRRDGQGYSNVAIQYGDTEGVTDKSCGVGAKLSFTGLTNWGTEISDTELAPDANSIQIVAFFSTCTATTTDPLVAKHTFKVASPEEELVVDSVSIPSSGNELKPVSLLSIHTYKFNAFIISICRRLTLPSIP